MCDPVCSPGFGDCVADDGIGADDGCETNTNDTVAACGACGRSCSNANTNSLDCNGGLCEPNCALGFDDCNADDGIGADDGCETSVDDTVTACGSCGRACSNTNATSRTCQDGLCEPACATGFGDCEPDDGNGPDDGCETDTDAVVDHCGACGRDCSFTNTSQRSCADGLCDPTCAAGFGDCVLDDGNGADDGCETNTEDTVAHCNACGRACSSANATTLDCSTGACAPTCDQGFGDCNLDDGIGPDDGCETDLNNTATCGTSCGNLAVCGPGDSCVDGVCTPNCPFMVCGGQCVDTDISTSHCGDCDRACSTANTTTIDCVAGLCEPSCAADFGDCNPDDGVNDDGCETDFNDPVTCGTSCLDQEVCDMTESCVDGVCTPNCTGTMCGTECVDLDTDENHCGACDHACLDGANEVSTACVAGACEPVCEAGRDDCATPADPVADDGCETDLNSTASCGTNCGDIEACGLGASCNTSVCQNQGVVVCTVPMDATGEGQLFNLLHQAVPLNLSGTSVIMRAWAPNAINGEINLFFTSPGGTGNGVITNFTAIDQGFFDITVPVPPAGGGFDPTQVTVIRFAVQTGGSPGPWQTPATIVYVDSIISANGVLNDTFNASAAPLALSGFQTVPGSSIGWVATLP
jgi:hypothetical protein